MAGGLLSLLHAVATGNVAMHAPGSIAGAGYWHTVCVHKVASALAHAGGMVMVASAPLDLTAVFVARLRWWQA